MKLSVKFGSELYNELEKKSYVIYYVKDKEKNYPLMNWDYKVYFHINQDGSMGEIDENICFKRVTWCKGASNPFNMKDVKKQIYRYIKIKNGYNFRMEKLQQIKNNLKENE